MESAIASDVGPLLEDGRITPQMATLARLAGACHDLGKATSFFQTYLTSARPIRSSRTRHAHLSAILTYSLGRRLLDGWADQTRESITLLLFATLSVHRHHGDLKNLEDDWRDFCDATVDDPVVEDQWSAIDWSGMREYVQRLLQDLGSSLSWEPPASAAGALSGSGGGAARGLWRGVARSGLAGAVAMQHVFSLVIGCDKLDAALYGRLPPRETSIGPEAVTRFRETAFRGARRRLDPVRETVFQQVRATLESSPPDRRIFTLTAPTGSGKTLAMLWAGLECRRRGRASRLPRVVYSLPFTSIVDQNFQVYQDVLADFPSSQTLSRHHHLTDLRFDIAGAEYAESEAELLLETWHSEVVVTTFHQVLHTFFSGRNSDLKRLFRLPGSVLLLDEVQAIPRKYWDAVREVLVRLSTQLGTTIILGTATRPLILEPGDAVELCPGNQALFEALDRVQLSCELEHQIPLSELGPRIADEVASTADDVLVIANTIASARALYRQLEPVVPAGCLFYLSTHVVPVERLERLDALRCRDSRKVLVSTQLVEAGVDLSFDRVYRDLAPLDSIIQAAGRCNRSGDGPRGTVRLYELLDDSREGGFTPSRVYDPILLDVTRSVLPAVGTVPESGFLDLTARYFDGVRRRTAGSEIEHALAQLRFEAVREGFQLIDERPGQTYFVIREQADHELWGAYQDTRALEDRRERREAFGKIRNAFQYRLITVAGGRRGEHLVLPLDAGGGPEGRYDPVIGYCPPEGGTHVF